MQFLTNGALILGLIYLLSGSFTFCMIVYFFKLNGNGLKSILVHLFSAWSAHYLIIGAITLKSYAVGIEVVSLNTLRLIASFFVFMQFIALCRIYFYITKKK